MTIDNIMATISAAERKLERIDGVVLPEMALSDDRIQTLCSRIAKWAVDPDAIQGHRDRIVVITGTNGETARTSTNPDARSRHKCSNSVGLSFEMAGLRVAPYVPQSKHHRSRLDESQVRQYGLGSRLGSP